MSRMRGMPSTVGHFMAIAALSCFSPKATPGAKKRRVMAGRKPRPSLPFHANAVVRLLSHGD